VRCMAFDHEQCHDDQAHLATNDSWGFKIEWLGETNAYTQKHAVA
jgi:hypothetical protein